MPIIVLTAATALTVEQCFLRKLYDRWRLVEVIVLGSFANGFVWGLFIGMLLWLRMRRFQEDAYIPHDSWYAFFIPWSCLSIVFTLAGLLPAGIVAIVYHRRRKRSDQPAA